MDTNRLQYQTAGGTWRDCINDFGDNRVEEFLKLCERFNGPDTDGTIVAIFKATRNATRAEVLAALEAGAHLWNDSRDWYSVCRFEPATRPTTATPTQIARRSYTCRSCGITGHGITGHAESYPFSTNPSSGYCDDCGA